MKLTYIWAKLEDAQEEKVGRTAKFGGKMLSAAEYLLSYLNIWTDKTAGKYDELFMLNIRNWHRHVYVRCTLYYEEQ